MSGKNKNEEILYSSEEEVNGIPVATIRKRHASQSELEELQKVNELLLGQPLKVPVNQKSGTKIFSFLTILSLLGVFILGLIKVSPLYSILICAILLRGFTFLDSKILRNDSQEELSKNEKILKFFVEFVAHITMCIAFYGIAYGIRYVYSLIF